MSFRCTSDTRICFTVEVPHGVILDEIIADQVRFHHVIFMEKFVLSATAHTNGELLTPTHTMLFHSGKKFCHTMQERYIVANPR